jgi:HrpA-like RNA helicase
MVKTKTAKTKNSKSVTSAKSEKSVTTLLSLTKDNVTGIYDPFGLYNNPLTNEPYKNLYGDQIKDIKGEILPYTYANISKIWTELIVYENKDALVNTIANNQIILATAGTGVGKTILIPRIALHALNYKGKVICSVPKRLPARENATFIAECMDVKLGEHVGYYYQGENQTNKNGISTKLIFTTTGSIISRMTGSDPMLSDYACVVVDEAHERSVETDQLLLLLKKLCKIRKDLKVIIMSATIALENFRNYYPASQFKYGEVDAGSETTHKVTQYFMERPKDWKITAVDITMKLLKKTRDGDIMIFVKSAGDANIVIGGIEKAMGDFRNDFIKKRKLELMKSGSGSRRGSGSGSGQTRKNGGKGSRSVGSRTRKTGGKTTGGKTTRYNSGVNLQKQLESESYATINPCCVKLEGSSPKEESNLATSSTLYKTKKNEKGYLYTRKIVVTTNVAESSITVKGIIYIIDSGYEYEDTYEPNTRARALLENNIAQSAVIQRKGRAGRIDAGYCFHLYSKRDFEGFQKYPTPSIEKSDITGNILDIMRMKDADTVKKMRVFLDEFISPPHEKFIINSLKTLEALGAITTLGDDGIITPMGLAISKFRAISPCFARSIIASHFYGVSRSMCDIIALAHATGGRIGNFFIKYYPDKKKSAEWNKKELYRHKNIMKSFEHPYGDYMSMLKAYRIYLALERKQGDDAKMDAKMDDAKMDAGAMDMKMDDGKIDAGADAGVLDDINPVVEDIKIKPSVRAWCRDNYLNPRKIANVRQVSMQLYRTLQDIIKPYQYEKPKGQGRTLSKKELVELKEKISIMEVNSVLSELDGGLGGVGRVAVGGVASGGGSDSGFDNDDNDEFIEQNGGFIRRIAKEEEMEKLESNVKRFEKEDDNIMMALAIGNFVNISIIAKGQKDMYVSCFAIKKTPCKIDRDSFVRGNPKIVLFEEIFMAAVDARILKLNMVNVLPNNVWERIKNDYGKFIKFCV